MTVEVGTSSWTDPTLVRDTSFYPKGAGSAEDRLRYYSSIFPVVEVDSTFYAPPSLQVSKTWVGRTPANFRMDVKAFGLFTGHPVASRTLWADLRDAVLPDHVDKAKIYATHLEPDALDEAWLRFEHALRPLHDAGKLGAVMFQWPPWFTAKRANRELLEQLPQRLSDYQLAVEFRHGSWMAENDRERTLDLLARNGLAYVVVDEPQGFKNSVPPVAAATADLAVVRFHGRNAENWLRKGITPAERFRYLYRAEELQEWVAPIRQLDDQANETHALMNNCYQDYGVRNAHDLARLLGEGLQAHAPTPSFNAA
jgi:uncharacterized protein YecE (DUF72 family)